MVDGAKLTSEGFIDAVKNTMEADTAKYRVPFKEI